MKTLLTFIIMICFLCYGGSYAAAETIGDSSNDDLIIAQNGQTTAVIAIASEASAIEKATAEDLANCIFLMSGARPAIADKADTITAALTSTAPLLVIGQLAIAQDPTIKIALEKVAKPNPVLRADAIVVRRTGNRIYLAGNNDDSHAYAVSEILHRWGCRWYLPTDFGQCIPNVNQLRIGTIDYSYAPPFEVRRYWLSWLGDNSGKIDFMRRNRFNEISVPNGHILGQYTKELVPPGKSMFNVPISEDRTAEHVAAQVLPIYASGKDVQLGMEDGLYESDSAADKELIALQYDKYFQTQSYTDAFMTFYNKVARRLQEKAPQSKARIGFLAYSNITLPPVRVTKAEKPLVAYLAPIDIDPIHSMDDPHSAPRREYRDMMYQWAKVMEGRVVIYDYDQSMLVWRDIPNPSHQAFIKDIKHYRDAGILGIDTESRGAMATTFLNLFLRGQCMWNPDVDSDTLLAEFYEKFYGPAAKPMASYWEAIYKAWRETLATEHEYFVAPSIYTEDLIAHLRQELSNAEMIIKPLESSTGRNEKLYVERIKFSRLSFEVLDAYMSMVRLAGTDVDYAAAVAAGERGLAAREKLTQMNGTFTTYKQIGESGYAWWPGEVQQYRELIPWIDGTKGTLVAKLPVSWSFRRDPNNIGTKENWATTFDASQWTTLRSNEYAQGQGVVTEDYQSYTGQLWYSTEIELTAEQIAGKIHLKFPGVFNEGWLFVNGKEVGYRPFKGLWWLNDYRFEWDVDLSGKLTPGRNRLTLRLNNPHHFGGMFRRPFLYRSNE
jgi:hypothetical protein